MRMVAFQMRGFRRFENAEINVDAPVVALVGPNESGKTTVLDALVKLSQNVAFTPDDETRDLPLQGPVLEALYLLDADDRKALTDSVPEASEVRWYYVLRESDGLPSFRISSPLLEDDDVAHSLEALNALRGDAWDQIDTKEMADLIGNARSTLGRHPSEYTEDQLSDLAALSERLFNGGQKPPSPGEHDIAKKLGQVVSTERKSRTQKLAISTLQPLTPRVLEFTENARNLRSEYNLQDPSTWNDGLKNLAELGEFSLSELARLAAGGVPQMGRLESLLRRANSCLSKKLSRPWSQTDDLEVNLRVLANPWLRIFVGSDDGALYRLDERSEGLRTFVALVAFLEKTKPTVPPMLVIDEADIHLHWDAQADLVNIFHNQEVAAQIVYSTHSPGCLPHDLGHGVRAVAPDPNQADRSNVKNRIWESDDGGFRPLLYAMGASTAAVTPHRYAVATEGISDFILLPSLLRQAAGEDSLPYQVVPGLAQLSGSGIRRIGSESDAVAYLTDGDKAGAEIRSNVESQDIPAERIESLPDGLVLEDLVARETLEKAVREQIRRSSGEEPGEEMNLPDSGRSAYLDSWYQRADVKAPNKRAIASRVLEMSARNPKKPSLPLLEKRHMTALKDIHESLLVALGISSAPPD